MTEDAAESLERVSVNEVWSFDVDADPAWDVAIPNWRDVLVRVGVAVEPTLLASLEDAGTLAAVEMAVWLADDDTVQGLNRDWRGRDEATNVLSFATWWDDDCPPPPAPDAPLILGDLALALPTVLAEAAHESKAPGDHFAHLVLHGVLHLLGYDHQEVADALEMEALETRLLAGLGIPDPYGDAGLRGEIDDE
ncbi:MAG: rRNA maturation RNase YbeY [Rhodospirillaceae bacterium]|nr:rRNA maturation RNase YbeY [Rhodospirillaceae bacterium]